MIGVGLQYRRVSSDTVHGALDPGAIIYWVGADDTSNTPPGSEAPGDNRYIVGRGVGTALRPDSDPSIHRFSGVNGIFFVYGVQGIHTPFR